MTRRSVAVFCGSQAGINPAWAQAAADLGTGLAKANIRLVFGGGSVGLMGIVADACLSAGGEVLGVIPQFLTRMEVAHRELSDLVVTESMHVRKTRMFDESDAFITLPGGVGTFDETMEIITWKQLRQHDKPILIANVAGGLDAMVNLLDVSIANGFMRESCRELYEIHTAVPGVLKRLESVQRAPHRSLHRL